MRIWIFFAGAAIVFSSCVSNKKVVYLQKDDVNKKDLEKDSVVRTYALDSFTYKIQPYDLISVRFQSLTPEEYNFFSPNQAGQNFNAFQGNLLLFGELVDEDGNIPYPVVGKVQVAGLTIFQAQDKLQGIADQYLESPVVKVRLLNYRITVLGEVTREGTITLNNNRVSLLEAIGHAGGLSELADRSNIKLIRQKGSETEVQYIDILNEDFMDSPYYYVYQNDIVIVPPLRQRPFRRYFGQNVSIILSSASLLLLIINLNR